MSLLKERDEILANAIAILKYGKSLDEIVEEFQAIKAKEEQLLLQQKAKEEQLLSQQKAKEEQLLSQQKAKEEQLLSQQKAEKEQAIINMHQKLAIDVATIANILNVPTNFAQEVLSKKDLV
jgi:hypothetical protein